MPEQVEKYFPGFLAFIDSTDQQIPRPVDKRRRTVYYSGKKKRHTIKTPLMLNKNGFIIHKIGYKKGRIHDYDIYKKNHPITSKQVVNVVDLGYLAIEKDYQSNYPPYQIEKRDTWIHLKKKGNTTKAILK